MSNNKHTEIDKEKVRERIDNFIQNDGQTNIYVQAPSKELVGKMFYAQDRMDGEVKNFYPVSRFVFSKILTKPSGYASGRMLIDLNRKFFRTSYQLERLSIEGRLIISLAETWMSARYYEKHPEDNPKGLRRLFSPKFWFQSPQEWLDKVFEENSQKAYEWLQEERPLEQCDLKNMFAIGGFYLIDMHNRSPKTTQQAPIDEFVSEQIRKVPKGIIEGISSKNDKGGFKLVNGEKIVDFDSKLTEIYF